MQRSLLKIPLFSKGEAISLVSADEAKQLFDIERLTQKKATKTLTLPALKSAKARVRAPWDLLPWMEK
jgi:superfamily II DNA/RNA helicase